MEAKLGIFRMKVKFYAIKVTENIPNQLTSGSP